MHALLKLDQQIFLLINHLPHNQFLNTLGLVLSGIGTAGLVWFILGIWLIIREEKKGHWFFVPLLTAGGLSYIITEIILKPLFARPRPFVEMGAIIVGSNLNDSYSLPSGHATIAFAMAFILARRESRWRSAFYTLAIAISISRIFLGKHYPFDVLVSVFVGWVIGIISLRILAIIRK